MSQQTPLTTTTGSVNTNFLSTLDPLFEKFNIQAGIVSKYSYAFMLVRYLIDRQLRKPVDQVNFYHAEDVRKDSQLVVKDAVSGLAGAPVTFELDPVSFDAANQSYARKWFNVYLPDNKACTIVDVDPANNEVTIAPKDNTYAITLTAGQVLIVGDSNTGEGSGQVTPIRTKLEMIQGKTQILKASGSASGTAATNAASVNVIEYVAETDREAAIADGLGNCLAHLDQGLLDFDMARQMAFMLYLGQPNNNPTQIVDNDPLADAGDIYATTGLIPAITQSGIDLPYTIGTLSVSDLDAWALSWIQAGIPATTPINYIVGMSQYTELENALLAVNASTFVQYTDQGQYRDFFKVDAKEYNASFRQMTKSNYTYRIMPEQFFNEVNGLGAQGYNGYNLGLMLPDVQVRDAKTREALPNVQFRYKELGGINRAMQIFYRGPEITGYDIRKMEMMSEMGVQIAARDQMAKVEGFI